MDLFCIFSKANLLLKVIVRFPLAFMPHIFILSNSLSLSSFLYLLFPTISFSPPLPVGLFWDGRTHAFINSWYLPLLFTKYTPTEPGFKDHKSSFFLEDFLPKILKSSLCLYWKALILNLGLLELFCRFQTLHCDSWSC